MGSRHPVSQGAYDGGPNCWPSGEALEVSEGADEMVWAWRTAVSVCKILLISGLLEVSAERREAWSLWEEEDFCDLLDGACFGGDLDFFV